MVAEPPLRRFRIWPRHGANERSKQFSPSVVLDGKSKAKPRTSCREAESRISPGKAEGSASAVGVSSQRSSKSCLQCEDGRTATIVAGARRVEGNHGLVPAPLDDPR